ncbi:MAG TPA: alpha/beta fold hydrolase [Acidimicrobiales bacterium]|nr:alpha/beta fold hydrolase [Acidimicrobiales bacterium]
MPVVQRDDAEIWWDERGEGDPVLLIQGLGYPSDMWYRLEPALAERYRVIRFDNRGVGRTGVPAGPYTIETMAGDAAAVLDAAGVGAAHVVGASMGGVIAQELVLTRPERVASLVLGCTTPGGAEAAPLSPEAMEMVMARATMSADEAAEVAVPFVYAAGTPRSRIDEDVAVRLANPTSPEGYSNQVAGVVQHAGTFSRLGTIAVPTLVVHGLEDRLVDPANAKILADAIPGARLELLPDASHVFFTDQPETTLRVLLDFLDQV